jgi:hypothetical protein
MFEFERYRDLFLVIIHREGMRDWPGLYKAKDNNVMLDSRIVLILVIMYYVLSYIGIYFPHKFTDVTCQEEERELLHHDGSVKS